jgi:hypothetical protein
MSAPTEEEIFLSICRSGRVAPRGPRIVAGITMGPPPPETLRTWLLRRHAHALWLLRRAAKALRGS